MFTKKQERGI